MAQSNYQILIEMKNTIIAYLEGEKKINEDALKAYDNYSSLTENDSEIRRMREREAIKLRQSISDLSRHIEVIKRMYPNEN
jgi:hypothetical protein